MLRLEHLLWICATLLSMGLGVFVVLVAKLMAH